MYTPKAFAETDPQQLRDFIRRHGFGTLITHDADGIHVSHVPMFLDGAYIVGHLAAENPQCEHLRGEARALCVFQGPHGYVSPTWYANPGVPTWNFTAVHAGGPSEALSEAPMLREIVETLANQYEGDRPDPWKPDYPERMLSAIVGFRVRIETLEGKFKLSQNRPARDRRGVIRALERSGVEADAALAALMRRWEPADD